MEQGVLVGVQQRLNGLVQEFLHLSGGPSHIAGGVQDLAQLILVYTKVRVSADHVEDYDVIFVGYPIWWNEAPAMIATFLDSYDFSGKTLVPFCTSSSDSIDNSLHIFTELCPEASIADGLRVSSSADLASWLESLPL